MISPINLLLIMLLGSHALLFAWLWQRRGNHRQRRFVLIVWLLSNMIITASQLIPDSWQMNIANGMLLTWVMVLVQSGLLGHYLHLDIAMQYPASPQRIRIWWGLVLILLIAIVASLFIIDVAPIGWRDLSASITNTPALLLPTALMLGGIILLNGLLSVAMMVNFYRARMPELANRSAFIFLLLTTSFIVHFILVSGIVFLQTPAIFLLLMVGTTLVYINHYYRVFDIRHSLLVIVELTIVTLLTAGLIVTGLMFVKSLPPVLSDNPILLILIASLLATLHIPIRQFIQTILMPIHQQKHVDLGQLIREFSKQISNAVDLDEVVKATQITLQNTMQIQRSAFILINNTFRQPDSAELIVLGQALTPEKKYSLHHNSPIFKSLALERVPIGVYDLRFNPLYHQAPANEHAFFATLQMAVYIPMISEGILLGILACDNKSDGSAYTRNDVYQLTLIGEQIGAALRSTRLIDDLQHLNTSMRKLNKRLEDAKEELEKLDSVKTDFITIASHELRTPLAQIRGYADIIDSLNEQGALEQGHTTKMVANLRKSTERMEELITAMLDVSQLDVDAMDLRPVNTTVESLVRLAIDPLQDAFSQRNLTLIREGLEALPTIHVDMQRIVQAFRNIILNAIKFTPDGGTITVQGTNDPATEKDEVDHILITIQDTGIGIDEKNLSLIFQKFYRGFDTQLHSTGMYKFMGAGPGLGLTIAQGIIEGHGGSIWAESTGNDMDKLPGTTFHIRIPTKPPEGTSGVLAIQNDKENIENLKRTQEVSALTTLDNSSE